jgi:secreted trypsin-like serine protease
MRCKTPVFPIEHVNDFSLSFQVSVPFTYGPTVQPISMTSTEPAAGSLSVSSGWAKLIHGEYIRTQLQAVEVFITSRVECDSAYADYDGITENMICAAVPDGGKDACLGDSGGPLVVGGQLVGIVSWGIGCKGAQYPRVYSNVATLKSFVTQVTGVQ